MNEQEAKLQGDRLRKWEKLNAERGNAYFALAGVESLCEGESVHKQSAFTENWRESRLVLAMDIKFSPTRGGERGVEGLLTDLNIEAHKLGQFLQTELRARITALSKAMEEV